MFPTGWTSWWRSRASSDRRSGRLGAGSGGLSLMGGGRWIVVARASGGGSAHPDVARRASVGLLKTMDRGREGLGRGREDDGSWSRRPWEGASGRWIVVGESSRGAARTMDRGRGGLVRGFVETRHASDGLARGERGRTVSRFSGHAGRLPLSADPGHGEQGSILTPPGRLHRAAQEIIQVAVLRVASRAWDDIVIVVPGRGGRGTGSAGR